MTDTTNAAPGGPGAPAPAAPPLVPPLAPAAPPMVDDEEDDEEAQPVNEAGLAPAQPNPPQGGGGQQPGPQGGAPQGAAPPPAGPQGAPQGGPARPTVTNEQLIANQAGLLAQVAALRTERDAALAEAEAARSWMFWNDWNIGKKILALIITFVVMVALAFWGLPAIWFLTKEYANYEARTDYEAKLQRVELQHNVQITQRVEQELGAKTQKLSDDLVAARGRSAELTTTLAGERAERAREVGDHQQAIQVATMNGNPAKVAEAERARDAAVAQLASFTESRSADVTRMVEAARRDMVRSHQRELEGQDLLYDEKERLLLAEQRTSEMLRGMLSGDMAHLAESGLQLDVVTNAIVDNDEDGNGRKTQVTLGLVLEGEILVDNEGNHGLIRREGVVQRRFPEPAFCFNTVGDLYTVSTTVTSNEMVRQRNGNWEITAHTSEVLPPAYRFIGAAGRTMAIRFAGQDYYWLVTFDRATLLVLLGPGHTVVEMPAGSNSIQLDDGTRVRMRNGQYRLIRNGQIVIDRAAN